MTPPIPTQDGVNAAVVPTNMASTFSCRPELFASLPNPYTLTPGVALVPSPLKLLDTLPSEESKIINSVIAFVIVVVTNLCPGYEVTYEVHRYQLMNVEVTDNPISRQGYPQISSVVRTIPELAVIDAANYLTVVADDIVRIASDLHPNFFH
jgi:hypothetical protein